MPQDNEIGVVTNSNLSVNFTEDVQAGSGVIELRNSTNGTSVETFDVNTSGNLSFNGTTVVIDPTSDLLVNNEYYVLIQSGAIEDLNNNAYAGFSDSTIWNFAAVIGGLNELSDNFNVENIHSSGFSISENSATSFDLMVFNTSGQMLYSQEDILGTLEVRLGEGHQLIHLVIRSEGENYSKKIVLHD